MLLGRLLGVDTGLKRTGLAISEPAARMVLPLAIIETGRRPLDAVALDVINWAIKADVEGIVIGLPLNMDGTEGAQSGAARAFGRRLSRLSDLPVEFWDERLTSHVAGRRLAEATEPARAARRHRRIDDLAAVALLESYVAAAGAPGSVPSEPGR